MGVTGLWRLIEPAGKPVPVESLENKVLAVDISIWLHQVVKGYQDAKGAPLPNAHLMGLFQRLCKLLYFRIKPVFVFDGGFPALKRETIAKRQDSKIKYNSESERLKREIALLLSKKTAIGSLLGQQISPKKSKSTQAQAENDDIFKLPALPQREEESESESDDETNSSASTVDLHSVDIESEDFKNMPIKDKYDLLVELKETRKMNSWGKLHTLPKKSDNFSDFQMQRLLKRRKVQECLQETEKEMGDTGMSLNDLESLLNEEGIDTKIENFPTRRIASDNTTRYLLINNVQNALADAKKREESCKTSDIQKSTENAENLKNELASDVRKATEMSAERECKLSNNEEKNKKDELEEDLEKAIKMSLECMEEPNTSVCTSKTDDSWSTYKSDIDTADTGSDSEDGDGYEQSDFSTAKAYIMQYSDFTHKTIDNIVSSKNKELKIKSKCPNVDKIIEELNNEKSIIVDKVDLSSDNEKIQNVDTKEYLISCGREKDCQDHNTVFEREKSVKTDVDMDLTQNSVVLIDSRDKVIDLDSSSEEITEQKEEIENTQDRTNTLVHDNSSDSSEGEFEEVLDAEIKSVKPVVQVTLTMNETLEDDIFADVFSKNEPDEEKDDQTKSMVKNTIIYNNKNLVFESKPVEKFFENPTTSSYNAQSQLEKNTEEATENMKVSESNLELKTQKESKMDSLETDSIKPNESVKKVISTETLNSMVAELNDREENLVQEQGRMERIGRNITEQMTKEVQELLQVFGIPYIVAPMEAEAQCAFLESINLTDGTITDDSDIWLFGGKTVYKNFFNQKKHVLQFLSERIEKCFNLSREQLILLALLVGSDYTTGVAGVGPVTALEILASFPFNKRQLLKENSKLEQYQQMITGLQEFKTWVKAGRRTDNIGLKKKLRNVTFGDDFPSVRVVQAYLDPNVEKSEEKFTWGELNITVLREYAKAKFGWSQNKLDVIVQPVLKRMLERKTQKTVHDFFKRKLEFQSLEDQMSKRVKAAVQKMDSENKNLEKTDVLVGLEQLDQPEPKVGQNRKGRTKKQTSATTTAPAGKKKKTVQVEKVCTTVEGGGLEINVPKTDRYQEIIPQRERDIQNILQNKLKAIEVFRKTNIDRKRKPVKKRQNLPKDKAELSESSDSN